MFKIGRHHFSLTMLISGETARYELTRPLRADSPESSLFAKTSILPLALKELIYNTEGATAIDRAYSPARLVQNDTNTFSPRRSLNMYDPRLTMWGLIDPVTVAYD